MKMQVVIIPRDLGTVFVTGAMKEMELTVKVHFIFPIGFPCNLDHNILFLKNPTEMRNKAEICCSLKPLAPISQNGQIQSYNSSAKAYELFECVRPFCEVGA